MTTTTETVKNRFRTLTAAHDQIEKLERQIVALNAALTASKPAAPVKAQNPTPPSAPAVNQPAPVATPPVVKSLDDMSLRELADAADAAAASGDKAGANRYYQAYSERKANR